jgi:twitching motility protein PilT
VEFIHPRKRAMMSQREVGTHTKTFRAALKGSLREDPDVIVIGELRDTETVRIALAASETGHLVIGTMNTPSAAKTIDRIIDLFPAGDQQQIRLTLAGGLKLVVSQRLIPNADRTAMMAACEVLPGSIALWNLIRDNKTFQIPSLQQRGKALGILRLDDSLADLVRSGRTTAQNVLPFAESPDELEAKIAGRPAVQLPPGMQVPGGKPPPAPPSAPSSSIPGASPGAARPAEAAKGGGLFGKAATIFGGKKGG